MKSPTGFEAAQAQGTCTLSIRMRQVAQTRRDYGRILARKDKLIDGRYSVASNRTSSDSSHMRRRSFSMILAVGCGVLRRPIFAFFFSVMTRAAFSATNAAN
jgi:hypothetical protein